MHSSIQLELTNLLSRLYGALDERDYEQVAACFDEEGVWTRQGKVLRGHSEIVAALSERSPSLVVHHAFSNCLLEQAESDVIDGRYLLTVLMADTSKQDPPLTAGAPQSGFCDVQFRLRKGRWVVHRMQARQPTFKATL